MQIRVYCVEEDPKIVLTTSTERLDITCQLLRKELWATYEPYCHIDFQNSRCLGMGCMDPLYYVFATLRNVRHPPVVCCRSSEHAQRREGAGEYCCSCHNNKGMHVQESDEW